MPETVADEPDDFEAKMQAANRREKLESDLKKAVSARQWMLIGIPVLFMNTIIQYSGMLRPGNLPIWVGALAFCFSPFMFLFADKKVRKLKADLATMNSSTEH